MLKFKYLTTEHTELAKLNGAAKEEIEDALHLARSSVGWSTYLSGLQTDFNKFKKEIRQSCSHVKKSTKKPTHRK